MNRYRRGTRPAAIVVAVVCTVWPSLANATPQFARTYGLNCTACHTLPPMLNARGQDFLQRGYRPSAESDLPVYETAPIAAWLTLRQEDRLDANFGEGLCLAWNSSALAPYRSQAILRKPFPILSNGELLVWKAVATAHCETAAAGLRMRS